MKFRPAPFSGAGLAPSPILIPVFESLCGRQDGPARLKPVFDTSDSRVTATPMYFAVLGVCGFLHRTARKPKVRHLQTLRSAGGGGIFLARPEGLFRHAAQAQIRYFRKNLTGLARLVALSRSTCDGKCLALWHERDYFPLIGRAWALALMLPWHLDFALRPPQPASSTKLLVYPEKHAAQPR